jgi:uncharacterized protein YjbI with pentapeptide repeats
MNMPKLVPVKPRIIAPQTGEIIPLEDIVRELLETSYRGQIWIIGPVGSGKTTALNHLAAVFFASLSQLRLLDCPLPETVDASDALVICTSISAPPGNRRTYRLAPWTTDDLIEYLLAHHKEHCVSVLNRLKASSDRGMVLGNPELWGIILSQMASDESILDIRSALLNFIDSKFRDVETRRLMQAHCFSTLMEAESLAAQSLAEMKKRGIDEAIYRIIRHRIFQVILAAEEIARDLANKSPHLQLAKQLPYELVREVANRVRSDSKCIKVLKKLISKHDEECHPMAASILHLVDSGWIPSPGSLRSLAGAYLDHVTWPDVDLEKVNLREADLRNANLEHANLSRVDACRANLRSAALPRASLRGIVANEATLAEANLSCVIAEEAQIHSADLQGVNLEGAILARASFHSTNLKGARLVGADLRQANFRRANVEETDFSEANLEGACLSGLKLAHATFIGSNLSKADLSKCDMEYMEMPAGVFRGANLEGALLTGSSMPRADFRNARLCQAGLADVDWEGADLRGSDLTNASFHLGSSRSGLVGSPIASEGTRTGFYTDDYTEQDFKPPEEIRKANLCGADLRGAKIEAVDFYLVDLRNALYDSDQEQHFRRCGAILETRAEA